MAALAVVGLLASAGCTDEVPTFADDRWVPIDAETIELRIPFDEFVGDFQVFGGFGSPATVGRPFVAHEYRDGFESRALLRFAPPPAGIGVIPSGGGASVVDSQYVAVGGEVTVFMDSITRPSDGPVELAAAALLEDWDLLSANWLHAVDTLGDARGWPEAGGGVARELGTALWDPEEGDSIRFQVDSASAAEWIDMERGSRGLRVSATTPGTLLRIRSATFSPLLRPSVNPDTLVSVSVEMNQQTFISDPDPGVSPEEIRVGGAPGRRAFIRIEIPTTIEEGSAVCETVRCPVEILPERVLFAGLALHTAPGPHPAFQPFDTIRVAARPALAADRIPRSPLGSSVQPAPRVLSAAAWGENLGRRVEIPMTRYVQELLTPLDEDTDPTPNTLALLSAVEPGTFPFATFAGPGQEGAPFLRIILTLTEGVTTP